MTDFTFPGQIAVVSDWSEMKVFECLSEIGYLKHFFQPETKDFFPMLF